MPDSEVERPKQERLPDALAAEGPATEGPATRPKEASDKPLLVDIVKGEPRVSRLTSIGLGLLFLGGVALLLGLVTLLLSAPTLESGWEGAWFVPRDQLAVLLPLALLLMAAGAALYLLGRARSPDDGE